MKTITIKTYKFEELDEKAKQTAIDNTRVGSSYMDYEWYEYVYEKWQEKLEALGFTDIDIMFSGFCSQGDGAMFEATVKVDKYLKAHKLGNKYKALLNCAKLTDNGVIKVKNNGHYYHEHSYTIESSEPQVYYHTDNENIQNKILDQFSELVDIIDEELPTLNKQIYNDLENEYECLTSDDCIAEHLEINEYEFLKDGSTKLNLYSIS